MKLVSLTMPQLMIPLGANFVDDWIETSWNQHSGEASSRRYVALQPIFDASRRAIAYEALSRSGWDNQFDGDADEATRRMIDDWTCYGLTGLTGGLPVFLNCTQKSLLSGMLLRLPCSTVLEILETVTPNDDVLQACLDLKKRGFRLALDDFRPSDDMQELVRLADFIKVDFRLSGKAERKKINRLLSQSCATLIAEKIETLDEFEAARQEGFMLFQGYFLERPTVFSRRNVRIVV